MASQICLFHWRENTLAEGLLVLGPLSTVFHPQNSLKYWSHFMVEETESQDDSGVLVSGNMTLEPTPY